jgi:hypothetical protein
MPYELLAYAAESSRDLGAGVSGAGGWGAPRTAYLLTAAMADATLRTGVIMPSAKVDGEWNGYDETAQWEILIALGAQTRVALKMLQDKLGMQLEMHWEETARTVCANAVGLARELVRSGAGPWVMPPCARCREIIGYCLCSLQIHAYFLLGFTPVMIAATCRQSADEAVAVEA